MNIYQLTCEWARKNRFPLHAQPEMPSTNDWAKSHAFRTEEEAALYLTEHQTHGRGRYERVWSDQGKGHFFLGTWSFRVPLSPTPLLTARIGLGAVEAFHKSFPALHWSLKAPNDVFLSGKKVAGILTETVSQGKNFRLMIGIGINALSSPKDLPEAISLREEMKILSESDWTRFLDHLKDAFFNLIPLAHSQELETWEQTQILYWLNKNPNLSSPYSSISQEGTLVQGDQKTNWGER